MNVGLLISGHLGKIILNELLACNHSLTFVFTDFNSKEIIDTCEKNKIPHFKGNPRNGNATSFIQTVSTPDLLLSVNYLFIIDNDIIDKTKGFSINIHGSLLPKYRGRTPHVWAIINGENVTGITAHILTTACDEGDIIYQESIEINKDDTGYDILQKFNSFYPSIVFKIISMVERNEVRKIPQQHSNATYFGKRTPEDGLINWSWHKERIKNWVRAQANPYPGAFSFYNGNKVIIQKIDFSEFGFNYNDTNGKILSIDNGIIVKTPNGAITISEYSSSNNNIFEIGKNFDNGN
ncbi:MAG: methionyl-tRNA formyltransferase [Chitinophagaceae bacterium]|nr:methionyl-tRNA formyltransferase [Chitinophagaceae bacterium]MCW5905664.1 methionyl-tRNA formyltransferase [Chitinophagaceae bacterium]